MSTALILIDIQNDYFPGGKMELDGSTEASLKARELLSFFRTRQLPVGHVRHVSKRPGAAFFLPGTEGAEIHENVVPLASETVIEKNFPNSFRNTRLLDFLKEAGISVLAIAGMMTHMCVDATVRAAFDYGFQCTVIHDACAARTLSFENATVPAPQVHAAFLAALAGTYARVVSGKEFLADFH